MPEIEYSLLLMDADFTVTLAPLAVRVAGKVFLAPTVTLPKFSVPGEIARAPELVPLPDSPIDKFELLAFDTTLIAPFAEPLAVGLNEVVKVTLWPAASVRGTETPLTEKPEPLALMRAMVTELFPVLVSTSLFDAVFPTCTLPKLTDVGLAASLPEEVAAVEPVTAIGREGFVALL